MGKTRANIKLTLKSLEEYMKGEGATLPLKLRQKVVAAVAELKAKLYGKADC